MKIKAYHKSFEYIQKSKSVTVILQWARDAAYVPIWLAQMTWEAKNVSNGGVSKVSTGHLNGILFPCFEILFFAKNSRTCTAIRGV